MRVAAVGDSPGPRSSMLGLGVLVGAVVDIARGAAVDKAAAAPGRVVGASFWGGSGVLPHMQDRSRALRVLA